MHESSKPEHLLKDAVDALGHARLTLGAVSKSWHRVSEEKAIRYALEQIDRAGISLCGLQDIVEGAKVESKSIGAQ